MCVLRRKEAGFTLLEALIAFLIITIGMAGAALFQSELIAESGASKARSVAVKLAEKELEEQRALLIESDYSGLDALVSSATPTVNPVSIGNTQYAVSFLASESTGASAVAENFYILTANVSWVDAKNNSDSVTINSFLSKNFADQSLDESSQAGSGNGDAGSIDKPGGAAEAIPLSYEAVKTNDVLKDANDDDILDADGNSIKPYENLDDVAVGGIVNNQDGTYGIKTSECEDVYIDANGNVVSQAAGTTLAYSLCGIASVIQLKNGSTDITEVFSISGDIYIHPGTGQDAIDNTISAISAESVVSDVLTSEGGGCAVYDADANADQEQLAYTCLFGGGWYGSIAINLTRVNPGKFLDTVCLSPRSYRYYILNPASGAESVVGQSGLVRFVSAGEGTYLSASANNPGFGYYYPYDQLVSGASGTSGNVLNQHFVIVGAKLDSFDEVDANCIDSGPLVLDGETYSLLTNSNYDYSPVSGADVVIPDNEIILGYVNKSYELVGTLKVSMAGYTAGDVVDQVAVVAKATTEGDHSCELTTASAAGSVVDYSCIIEHEWADDIWFGYAASTSLSAIKFNNYIDAYSHPYEATSSAWNGIYYEVEEITISE